MSSYTFTLILICVKISSSYVEQDGRIIEYDNFEEFKVQK